MSRARELSKLGNINVLSADDVSSEVGIATTVPRSTLDVRGEVKVGTAIQAGTAGVLTATSFDGGLSGNIVAAACTFTTGNFTGNVTIGGTLTYEDVTNVDALGIVTARSGVNVSGGQFLVGSGITFGSAGVATFSGTSDVHLLDNVRLNVGDGSDLTIYHDGGTASVIDAAAGNYLYIYSDNLRLNTKTGAEKYITGTLNGAVEAYYDNSKKFETSTTGATITGEATATAGLIVGSGLTIGSAGVSTFSKNVVFTGLGGKSATWNTGNGAFELDDDTTIKIGNGADLRIYHNGSHSYIQDEGTGSLYIDSNQLYLRNADTDNVLLYTTSGGAVRINYNGNQKIETTTTGATISGEVTADGLIVGSGITMGSAGVATFSGTSDVHLLDNVELQCGDAGDLDLWHDGSHSYVRNVTGTLNIRSGSSVQIANWAANETYASFTENGSVDLYYDNSKKFETTNDGVVITGITTSTGVIDAQGYINLAQKIVHTGDTDTSIEFDTNTIKFETQGGERLRINSDGYIQINNTNIEKKLSVKETSTSSGVYYNAAIGGANHLAGYAVGIGFDPESSNARCKTGIVAEGTGDGYSRAKLHFLLDSANDSGEATLAESRMTILDSGKVGIGTVVPARRLVVNEGSAESVLQITNGTSGIGADDGFQIIHYTSGATQLLNRENESLSLHTNNTERFRVGSSGQLGIGGATYGTSGQVLTSGGSGAAPSWADAGGGATEVIQSWDFGSDYGQNYFETSATGITTSSGFIAYELIISGLQFVGTPSKLLGCRVYKSGGSLESGDSYKTYCKKSQFTSTSDENETNNSTDKWTFMGTGNNDRQFWDGRIKWENPGYTTGKTMPPFMRAEWYQQARFAHFDVCQVFGFGNTDYISGIRVYNVSDSTNLMSGRACLIGYKFA